VIAGERGWDEADLADFGLVPGDVFPALAPQLYRGRVGLELGCRCRVCGAEVVLLDPEGGDRRVLQFFAEHRHREEAT
jgi:hypothetical protein